MDPMDSRGNGFRVRVRNLHFAVCLLAFSGSGCHMGCRTFVWPKQYLDSRRALFYPSERSLGLYVYKTAVRRVESPSSLIFLLSLFSQRLGESGSDGRMVPSVDQCSTSSMISKVTKMFPCSNGAQRWYPAVITSCPALFLILTCLHISFSSTYPFTTAPNS